jgi:uncharacterized protein YukE
MAGVSMNFDAIENVANTLASNAEHIASVLQVVQAQVSALVTGQDLHLEQSSPALNQAYTEFNTALNKNIQGMHDFGTQFRSIVQNMRDMDGAMAKALTTK